MKNTVELTPAELEMIKVKREREALAKKEAEAKQAIQLEKDIKAKEEYITKTIAKDAEQIAAAKAYQAELGGMYAVQIKEWEEEVKVMGDYINREEGFDRHVLWVKTFTRQFAWIVRGSYKIKVEEQITYSSKWSSRGTSQGYKMYISGPGIEWKQERRAYARTAKVNEVIKAAMDQIDYEKKQAEAKKNAVQTTVDRFTAEYPDAEVTTDKGWESGYGSRKYISTPYDIVRVKFANGCSISYRVYGDGSLSRLAFNLPGAKDEATFRNNLSQMKF